MAHAGNGASRSRMGGVGPGDSPLGLILSVVFLAPLALFLLARRDRKLRKELWGRSTHGNDCPQDAKNGKPAIAARPGPE